MNPPILRFFKFAHLPPHLQEVSRPFHDLAHLIEVLPGDREEKNVALRKLLEAKDAAVRSMIP